MTSFVSSWLRRKRFDSSGSSENNDLVEEYDDFKVKIEVKVTAGGSCDLDEIGNHEAEDGILYKSLECGRVGAPQSRNGNGNEIEKRRKSVDPSSGREKIGNKDGYIFVLFSSALILP